MPQGLLLLLQLIAVPLAVCLLVLLLVLFAPGMFAPLAFLFFTWLIYRLVIAVFFGHVEQGL